MGNRIIISYKNKDGKIVSKDEINEAINKSKIREAELLQSNRRK